jgi:uncharacterized membrane protein
MFVFNEMTTLKGMIVDLIQAIVGSASLVFLVIVFVKYLRLSSKIRNSRLNEALNNELYEMNRNKSLIWGFWSFLICMVVFLCLTYFFSVSAKLVCLLTIYAGVLSTLVSGLIYNREAHDNSIDK